MQRLEMIIGARFCGPPDSGNGGYTAGCLAHHLGGVAEITLRSPPPLDRELEVHVAHDCAELRDGETLIAEGRQGGLDLKPPAAPSFEQALTLAEHYVGFKKHNFPGCFVCGPARAVGDGLRIFPGCDEPTKLVAAPWIPHPNLADPDGVVRPEFMWAALDCAGYFAVAAPDYPNALLGRMTAELRGPIRPNDRCVVVGWPLAREGRKLYAGTAIYDQSGELRGRAMQTWIAIARVTSRPPPAPPPSMR